MITGPGDVPGDVPEGSRARARSPAPPWRVEDAVPGAVGVDTVQVLDAASAASLRASVTPAVRFAVRYLGSIRRAEADAILGAGLMLQLVTFGGWCGPKGSGRAPPSATDLRALGAPAGATAWLDVEDVRISIHDLTTEIDRWSAEVRAAGYVAGAYVGPGSLLTSEEWYARPSITRYWKAASRVLDRYGRLQDPECGYCMVQLQPANTRIRDAPGVLVDLDVVQADLKGKGRVPTWITRS